MAYHAENSGVHHTHASCTTGNNIEKKNRRTGTGGKRLCKDCADLSKGKKR